MLIQIMSTRKLVDRDPIPGLWYHGLTYRGEVGAMAICLAPGCFEAEEVEADMTKYPVLVEHDREAVE